MDSCLFCGNKFEQKEGRGRIRKYCSDNCRRSADYEKVRAGKSGRTLWSLVCVQCGTIFKTREKMRKYCSRECTVAADTKYKGMSKVCPVCGVKFQLKSSAKQIYCSILCHAEDARKPRGDILNRKRIREKTRKLTDPCFALKCRVRSLMYHSLRGGKGGRKWQDIVGYSVDDLRRHIQKKFRRGMTWERFMAGDIHIDHKIPITAFNFTSPEDIDFKKCWSLKNLRPMWAVDNMSKGDKLERPFQPSFAIGA